MKKPRRIQKPVQVGFLAFFILLTAGINFLHTETSTAGQANCPACHFQAFNLSIGPALIFALYLLIILGTVLVDPASRLAETDVNLFFSRSPPSA